MTGVQTCALPISGVATTEIYTTEDTLSLHDALPISAVAAVARRLPRRNLTTMRAESLINDGTALVLYAAAVGVAIGTVQPSWWRISGDVLLSYLGGIAVGLIVIVTMR